MTLFLRTLELPCKEGLHQTNTLGNMSGDQLRHAAIIGDANRLSHLLSGGANPCSADAEAGGMTALHYAAWNGHADCVVRLLANDRGKMPGTGEDASCVDLTTEAGCTALHLCAMSDDNGRAGKIDDPRCDGGPEDAEGGFEERGPTAEWGGAAECCRLLIMFGADTTLRDEEGRTPLEVGEAEGNDAVRRILQELTPSLAEVEDYKLSQREEYGVQTRRSLAYNCVGDVGDWISRCCSDYGALGPDRRDQVPVPQELDVHEHRLLPFAKRTFESDRKEGARKIRDLISVWNQAERNVSRRELLANARWRGEWKRINFPKVLKPENM